MPKNQKEDPYYAVARGTEVGIYRSWDEAKLKLVPGVAQKHKKFKTLREAEEFIAEHRRDGYLRSYPKIIMGPSKCASQSQLSNTNLLPSAPELNVEQWKSVQDVSDSKDSTLSTGQLEFISLSPSNLVASPICDVLFDTESRRDSEPQLLRLVELVSLPDIQEEWGWETGSSSSDSVESWKSDASSTKLDAGFGLPTAKSLLQDYKLNYEKTEGLALSYISEDLHHPVISCFREITKTDVNMLFSLPQGKLRKSFNNHELAVLCMGLIDYMAVSVNNPLYENSKSWGRSISASVEKVMSEFKGIIRSWAMSDQDYMQKRVDIILSYLHKLVPLFRAVGYNRNFESTIHALEFDIMKKQQENPGKVRPLFEVRISKSIFEETTEEEQAFEGPSLPKHSKQKEKSKMICDKAASSYVRVKKETDANKNKKKQAVTSTSSDSKTITKRAVSSAVADTDEVILLDSGNPNPAKKARFNPSPLPINPITPTPASTNTVDANKEKAPLRNAFSILMDRSRQIANQKKLMKLAKEQSA